MSQSNSTKPGALVFNLLLLDVPAVLAVTILIQRGIIALYPGAAISCLLLFVVNFFVVLVLSRQSAGDIAENRRVPFSLWVAAAVFTPAGTVAIVLYVMEPSMAHGVQAFVAVLLVSNIWYMVYRLMRRREVQVPR